MTSTTDKMAIAAMKGIDWITRAAKQFVGTEDSRDDRGEIRVTYDLEGSAAKVWQALTEPALLREWLFENDFTAEEGRAFAFRTGAAPGFDGVIRCQIVHVEDGRELVYRWNSGPARTIVRWVLEPVGPEETQLHLSQSGFRPDEGWIYEMLKGGWSKRSGDKLRSLVARL